MTAIQEVAVHLPDRCEAESGAGPGAQGPLPQDPPRSPGEHFITEWALHHGWAGNP